MIYHGKATLEDGTVLETDGAIMDIANWADRIIQETEGNIRIDITRRVNRK